jgi:deoxycytidylate deaminase/aminoglycoside phosphotransferase (APT) family kinase protein
MLPDEIEQLHCILTYELFDLAGSRSVRINRGISNAKYCVTSGRNSFVVKIFSEKDHRRRALNEYAMLLCLHGSSNVPVPTPIRRVDPESKLPVSYVMMSLVDGIGLDELIHQLSVDEISCLGAEVGRVLYSLHHIDVAIAKAFLEDQSIKGASGFPPPDDEELATDAQRKGVLTAYEANRYLQLRTASYASMRHPSLSPSLTHGDLGLDNIIIDASHSTVAALVDFAHSVIGDREVDFVKMSAGSGPRIAAFTDMVVANYLESGAIDEIAPEDFPLRLKAQEMLTDLKVALDIASDPFRDVFSLAAGEHQAWLQTARLYRTLRQRQMLPLKSSLIESMEMAQRLASTSTCKVRQVGVVIVDEAGNVLARGINQLMPAGARCWCFSMSVGSTRPNCPALHAERNAIATAKRNGGSLGGSILLSTTCPCIECARWIVREGVAVVAYVDDYIDNRGLDYLLASGLMVEKLQLCRK